MSMVNPTLFENPPTQLHRPASNPVAFEPAKVETHQTSDRPLTVDEDQIIDWLEAMDTDD